MTYITDVIISLIPYISYLLLAVAIFYGTIFFMTKFNVIEQNDREVKKTKEIFNAFIGLWFIICLVISATSSGNTPKNTVIDKNADIAMIQKENDAKKIDNADLKDKTIKPMDQEARSNRFNEITDWKNRNQ